MVEILWFILWPIRSELRVWRERWPEIRQRARGRTSALALMLVCGALVLPWPGRITASAVLRPQEAWPVFAPAGARVEALPLAHGAQVSEGQQLLALHVPELASREQALAVRMAQQRWQTGASGFDEDMRKRWKVAEQTLVTTEAEWQGLQAERSQFQPQAPYPGRYYWADPDLSAGQWVGKKEPLGTLVRQGSAWRVETWLDEDEVARLRATRQAAATTATDAIQ